MLFLFVDLNTYSAPL